MSLSAEEIQAIVTATTTAVLTALGRTPAKQREPIADAEKPAIAEFFARAYPRAQRWSEPRFKTFAIEADGPHVVPSQDPAQPDGYVMQLHVFPVEAIRAAMKAEREVPGNDNAGRRIASNDDRRKVG